MRVLRVLAIVALASLAAPPGSAGQSAGHVWRMGVLMAPSADSPLADALREALRELGYVEGRNIAIEWRSSGGKAGRFPDLAAELVRQKVDVIVASDNPAIAAAQRATTTIPIVMVLASDPVATGFVGSLARPGGNITGLTSQATELQGKGLQLLKEAVPTISRVALVWNPDEPGRRTLTREVEVAARTLTLKLQLLEARNLAELDGVFTVMARERMDAVFIQASQTTFTHRVRIAELAAKSRLPTICMAQWYAEAGGLMSYGPSNIDRYRRAAYYVDKLFRGSKAADLPVEQPTKFELVVNLKTARALGLTVPEALLRRVDRVIE
jgi:putative ABC transport system substrate-binding protein